MSHNPEQSELELDALTSENQLETLVEVSDNKSQLREIAGGGSNDENEWEQLLNFITSLGEDADSRNGTPFYKPSATERKSTLKKHPSEVPGSSCLREMESSHSCTSAKKGSYVTQLSSH
ncbi:unnamed protein product, partial [Sphenostylis stenocarpa]